LLMISSTLRRVTVPAIATFVLLMVSAYLHAATLSPLASFGGNSDGWRAPNESIPGDVVGGAYPYLGTGSLERGLTFNPATGNLILVSRSTAGNGIRILNGVTGVDTGALNQGTGIISGGTFAINMVDATADGIYVGNLSTSAASNFRVYRWSDELPATLPTVAHDAASGLARTGDSFAATGSGAGTKLGAAGTLPTGVPNSAFVILNTADGLSYSPTAYLSVPGTTTTSNDYRLSLSFVDSDTVIGNQGTNARITDFGAGASVAGSVPLSASQRPIDYAVIAGVPVMAVIDTNSSLVQVLDITTPGTPVLLASANNTSGSLTANGNGTGSVAWGTVSGVNATLYAMSSNQGIQAFNFVIPEPSGLVACLAGLVLLAARRVRN
jgi:hypothetical protein